MEDFNKLRGTNMEDFNKLRVILSRMLNNTVDSWFYNCQSALNITDDSCAWDLETLMDKQLNNLCDACIDVLKYQHKCAEEAEKIKYVVDDYGNCNFLLGKHIFSVGRVDNIHEDNEYHEKRTTDVAILYCYYDDGKDNTGAFHLVPDGYIYGATNIGYFKEGATVHTQFIKAAKKFIKNTWNEEV